MRRPPAPMLFNDTDTDVAEALRPRVVARAQRSLPAIAKLTEDGLPTHSLRSLLTDRATLARNTIITAITPLHPLTKPMAIPA